MLEKSIFNELSILQFEIEQFEFKSRNTFNLDERVKYSQRIKENYNQIDKLLDQYNVVKELYMNLYCIMD